LRRYRVGFDVRGCGSVRIVCGVDEHVVVVSFGVMKTTAFEDAAFRNFAVESSIVLVSCSLVVLVDVLVDRVVRLGGIWGNWIVLKSVQRVFSMVLILFFP
jgi:hypothetical protein